MLYFLYIRREHLTNQQINNLFLEIAKKNNMSSPLWEIESKLKKHIKYDPEYKMFREKTTKMSVWGLRLPVMQKIVRDGFTFYDQSEKTILKIWNEIWNTGRWHEILYLPLFYYRKRKDILGKYEWSVMKHWIERVENWEHSDSLSYLYSIFFERFPKMVLPTLKQWNKSKNPWKQRISIVSLIYYVSPNRISPSVDIVLNMVEPLIKSKDKYVNKAVGWTLRESYKLYPKETFTFIKKHIHKLSANSFSYATEKVSKQQKMELKQMRSSVSS